MDSHVKWRRSFVRGLDSRGIQAFSQGEVEIC